MRRLRARRRLPAVTVVLLAVSGGAATVLSADGPGEHRSTTRSPATSPPARAPTHQRSLPASTPQPATASPQRAAIKTSVRDFLIRYLALLHGRGSIGALRHVAARGLLRELRRDRPRVTPVQQRTPTRTMDLRTAFPSPGSARAVATLKDRGGPPYPLRLYLERRGTRWVVTRIGDA